MGLFGKNRSTPVRNLRRPFPAPVTISATAPLAMELNGALAAARLRKVKRRSSRIALLHQNNAPR
ncbi:hypothetical protein FA208_21850 [Pseudomonas aeruginosa]|nr:hypothetical protein [Pseudomonas aeruginosa]